MPVQYSGVIDEHRTVRNAVGLFDVSHMGEIAIRGPQAYSFLQFITSNDVSKLTPGKAQYSFLLNHAGGVVDDIIVYQLADEDFLLCVNAGNTPKVFTWLTDNLRLKADIENVSHEYAQIAIQGPKAVALLAAWAKTDMGEFSLEKFPSFSIRTGRDFGIPYQGVLIARTGYTGEDGFEIFSISHDGLGIWRELLTVGEQFGVKPAGLGARDTLRLEAALPLHGHELRDDLNALSSGLAWVVKFEKGDFLGREALDREKNLGLKSKLIGFEVCEQGIVREGTKLYSTTGEEIGFASSGTKTPTLNKAIGLGFVRTEFTKVGTEIRARVRERELTLRVIKLPFYRKSY